MPLQFFCINGTTFFPQRWDELEIDLEHFCEPIIVGAYQGYSFVYERFNREMVNGRSLFLLSLVEEGG